MIKTYLSYVICLLYLKIQYKLIETFQEMKKDVEMAMSKGKKNIYDYCINQMWLYATDRL